MAVSGPNQAYFLSQVQHCSAQHVILACDQSICDSMSLGGIKLGWRVGFAIERQPEMRLEACSVKWLGS